MRRGADRYNQAVKVPNKSNALFVAKNGNDANAGTYERPKLTIANAVAGLVAGQTLYIRAGTYAEHVHTAITGSTQARVTVRNYPGEKALWDGGAETCLYVNDNHDFWTVFGLYFTSDGNAWGIAGMGLAVEHDFAGDISDWIFANNVADCAIQFSGSNEQVFCNLFDGSTNAAHATNAAIFCRESRTTGLQIFKNCIDNWTQRGIWCYDQVQDPQIWHNRIRNISDPGGASQMGINLDGFGSHSDGGDIYENWIQDIVGVAGTGITLENPLTNPVVWNNHLHNCSVAVGVICYDAPVDHRATLCNGTIFNNIATQCGTFYKTVESGGWNLYHNLMADALTNDTWVFWLEGDEAYLVSLVFKNNIYRSNGDPDSIWSVPLTLTLIPAANTDYNDWNQVSANVIHRRSDWAGTTFANWVIAGRDTHSTQADPLFTAEVSYDFTLQAASPARNTGVNAGIAFDVINVARPLGGAYDMGPYERA